MDEFIEKLWGVKAVRYVCLALLTAMALVSLIQGVRNAAELSQDFQWDAAKAFGMRIDPYELSFDTQKAKDYPPLAGFYGMFEDKGLKQQMEANQFPSLLILLIPYTFLPPLAARYAWIISNLIFTAGIIFLLRRTFLKEADRDLFAVFMLLMIAGTPYRNQLGVGQHTLFSFFFFLLAVWCESRYDGRKENGEKGRDHKVSVALVICLFICYFKYTLTVPLCLYFVYKKRWPEIVISAGMHVVLTAFSAVWLRDSFINMIVKPLKVSSALAAEGGLDLGALLNGSSLAYVLALLIMAGLLTMAVRLSAKSNGNTGERMDGIFISVLILWSLIITYHRTYDFFVMITVLAFFLARKRKGWFKAGYAVTLVSVFFILRVFSESDASRIAIGAVYYLFTIAVTVSAVRDMKDEGSNGSS
ncbi:MAG: DUF2029 domain-containing protein [Lachnospiraceae bacterium]|nr:DUF2029 domain-containing protein [Lachnospiraceae bacterium]